MDDSFFILLGLTALGALALGPIGFFLALGARRRLRAVEAQLDAALRRLGTPAPEAPPAPERAQAEQPVPAPEPARPAAVPASPATPVGPARPRRSLEEALGARWTVWVGGVALALGALLLVRYSFEQGFFGPGMRVLSGLALAMALVAGGEFMRRRAPAPEDAPTRRADIPSVLIAAGTIAAFGAIYAAHALYGFIGPATAFVALGATGVACMFASALHGPALAAIGLVGALLAPALVSAGEPTPWPVAIHAAVVVACAYWLARLRLWFWLALSAAAGAGLWGVAFIGATDGDLAPVFFAGACAHALVQLWLAALAFAWAPARAAPEAEARPDWTTFAVPLGFGALLLVALTAGAAAGQYGAGWIAAAALGVASLGAAGFVVAPAAGALGGAGLFATLILRVWPSPAAPPPNAFWEPALALDQWPAPVDATRFAIFALLAAAGLAGAAAWRLRLARALPLPTIAIYAGAATLTPLLILILAYVRMTDRATSFLFAALAAGLGAGFTAAAAWFRDLDARETTPALRLGLGAFAAAALAGLSLGLVFALDGGALTVALALAALGAAHVSVRLDIGALRWCVAALGLAVAARLAHEPRVVADLGTTPIVNWLLFGYGLPALAFGYAARILRLSGGEDTPTRIAQSLAILLTAFLVFFEIRHAMNGGDPYAPRTRLVEQGLFAVSALGFAIVLTRLDAARGSIVFRAASLAAGAIAFALIAVRLGLTSNPLFYGDVEGGRVLNGLLLAYAFPALLALALAIVAAGVRPYWYTLCAKISAIALAFGYATLQTRRMFHDADIGFLRATTQGEWYAYSAVWLSLGVALLAWGLLRGSREARLASAVFVSASVLKVFLFDLAGLEGALRALSFIGLGLALIGIGLVYQKLVFARPAADPQAPTPA